MVAKKKNVAQEEIKSIRDLADINESYFIGLMWNTPVESYTTFSARATGQDFLHDIWGFYFDLGNRLYKKGLQKFDEISINATVEELGMRKKFEEYGGVDTVRQLINIVKENEQNIESYYDALLKNKVITSLMEFLGDKVITNNGRYEYRKMNARQISTYWQDKMNGIAVDSVSNYESENLYIEPDAFLENLETQTDGILPFYSSRMLNSICQGIPRGEVTMIGGFGNSGKSSFTTDKVIMACVTSEEKTLIVLNEEGADKLREKLILSLINHEVNEFGAKNQQYLPRWKFNNVAHMDDDDRELIYRTFEKWKELTEGDEAHIKIVFMEQYQIEDLKNIVALHANRGYVNLIIDTHKVPDNYKSASRWEAIVEATKEIYKFSRKESGGFNLRTVLTVQLADNHIKDRFLGYDAIGEGKAMKNEASILMMYRPLFTDEFDKLKVYSYGKSDMAGNGKRVIIPHTLDPEKNYYVMFIPKNRYGMNTDNGQDPIVFEANFDFNSFREIGYTKIARNYA